MSSDGSTKLSLPKVEEELANFSGDGAGALTDGTTRVVREFQEVSYPIPGEATDLVVRFEAWNTTWFNEIAAFDNVIITSGAEDEAPLLSISRGSEGAMIEFDGTLQSAAALDGDWTDVEDAMESPYTVPFDSELSRQFFRAR